MEDDTLDVDALVPWDPSQHGSVEEAFNRQFSLTESVTSMMTGNALDMKGTMGDPHFDARLSVFMIGKYAAEGRTRIMFQLGEFPHQASIIMDILQYKGHFVWCRPKSSRDAAADGGSGDLGNNDGKNKSENTPIVFVRYGHHTIEGTDRKYRKRIGTLLANTMPSCGVVNAPCPTTEELNILTETLLANSKMLSKRFLKDLEKRLPDKKALQMPASRTSFVLPLVKPEDSPEQNRCALCGIPSKAACARCKAVHYCGRECQRAHWKASHKKECLTPEQAATRSDSLKKLKPDENNNNNSPLPSPSVHDSGDHGPHDPHDQPWVDVCQYDGDNNPYPNLGSGAQLVSFSFKQSKSDFLKFQDTSKAVFGKHVARDVKVVVKVQIKLGTTTGVPFRARDAEPIMIYPRGKTWMLMASPSNVVGGYRQYCRLHDLVYSRGYLGGSKVYLDAYVTQGGRLRVMLNHLHPLPIW